jgi:hypothetical protein
MQTSDRGRDNRCLIGKRGGAASGAGRTGGSDSFKQSDPSAPALGHSRGGHGADEIALDRPRRKWRLDAASGGESDDGPG